MRKRDNPGGMCAAALEQQAARSSAMRTSKLLLSLSLFASPAFAQRTPARPAPAQPAQAARPRAPAPVAARSPLVAIDLDAVPAKCHPLATQASVVSLPVALQARMSLASCIAEAKLATLQLVDAHESVLAVDDATAHSMALYDEVIANGDVVTQIVAEQAKGDLYTNMSVRMMATVPPATAGDSGATLRATRTQILEDQLAPWRARAAASAERIVALAKANPKLAQNPVVQAAVRASKDRLRARAQTAALTPPSAPAPEQPAAEPPADDGSQETLR